jgi:Tol biopolymer transport system component
MIRMGELARSCVLTAALLGVVGVKTTSAQPATDIFLADVAVREGVLQIGAPRNVTQRDGYDNQPWFEPDGSAFLYSSERGGQIDIYRYDIGRGTSTRVTNTPENEYSPSLPGDGSRLLVVRWPTDMSTGALWWFTPDGAPLEEARGSVPRVGYYTFADEHTLALFINDSVQSFMLSDMRTGEAVRIGQQLNGSAPRTIPGTRAVSFQRRGADGEWWLMRLDIDTREATPLVRMVGDVANYAWTPHGTVLAAVGNTIHEWRDGTDEWRQVIAFDDPMLQGITRIAITAAGDRIALVSARP